MSASPAPRLDATIAKALCDDANAESEHGIQFIPEYFASAAAAVREALVAEGRIEQQVNSRRHTHQRVLVFPLESES